MDEDMKKARERYMEKHDSKNNTVENFIELYKNKPEHLWRLIAGMLLRENAEMRKKLIWRNSKKEQPKRSREKVFIKYYDNNNSLQTERGYYIKSRKEWFIGKCELTHVIEWLPIPK